MNRDNMDATELKKLLNSFMQPAKDQGPLHEVKVQFDDGTYHYELRAEDGHAVAMYGEQTAQAMARYRVALDEAREQVAQTDFERDYPIRKLL